MPDNTNSRKSEIAIPAIQGLRLLTNLQLNAQRYTEAQTILTPDNLRQSKK